MDNIQTINKNLKLFYGLEVDGNPRFRLVFSTGLIEKRYGTFNKFYKDTNIWLGRHTGLEERPKYNFVKDKWVLERYQPTQKLYGEIKAGDNYEPRYVFQDKNNNYLKPIWKVVEIICTAVLNAESGNVPKRTEKMDEYDYEKKLDKEVLDFMDVLDITPDSQRFRSGETILLPGINF